MLKINKNGTIRQSYNKKKIFLIIFLLTFLFCSCSPTVKNLINTPEFTLQNKPQRVLDVLIVTEKTADINEITQWLNECSQVIDEQVGITLKPTHFVQVQSLPSANDMSKRLSALSSIGKNHKDWELMINLTNYEVSDVILGVMNLIFPVPIVEGYIDDANRRIIVLKSKDSHTFIHEFFHAFIFSHDHSGGGVMSAMTIQALPFTPPLNSTNYLSKADRDEVLKNKWRRFREKNQLSMKGPG